MKNPIPGTRALQISSCLSLACSQALLRLTFFHHLPHLWLSTMLLKVHHFISLHFSLFTSHFAFTSILSQSSRHASGHIDIVTSLASHFAFGHFITHTLSLSLIFPSAFTSLHSATSRLHITHLGLTSHISASLQAPWPHVTHLRFASLISASHSPFGFYFIFVLVLQPSLSRTVSHLGFTSRISASCHASRPHVTHLGFALHALLRIFTLSQAFNY